MYCPPATFSAFPVRSRLTFKRTERGPCYAFFDEKSARPIPYRADRYTRASTRSSVSRETFRNSVFSVERSGGQGNVRGENVVARPRKRTLVSSEQNTTSPERETRVVSGRVFRRHGHYSGVREREAPFTRYVLQDEAARRDDRKSAGHGLLNPPSFIE